MGSWESAGRVLIVALGVFACAALADPVVAGGAPLPLGTVTLTSDSDPTCPAGHTCQGVQVTCPAVSRPARAFLATAPATAPVRGLVMLASGGGGTGWWSGGGGLAASFVDSLRADGFVVVQLRWVDPWLASAPGEDAGSGHLACRPATIFKWVHDKQFVPLGVPAATIGTCGFCISGNSGGASQVSYALTFYGLASILDAVVPTSGPPHAAQAKGCLRNAGQEAYWYDASATATIDSSYGFAAGQGPCATHDASFIPRWDAESADTGGNDFFYPRTRVVVILGGQDASSAPPHARDFAARLNLAGTPYLTLQTVTNMAHPIQQSSDGLAALHAALLATGGGYPRPKGATPLRVPLVPAYQGCSSSNRTHGAPLSFPSCAPPIQASQALTIGTPDANGQPAASIGSVTLRVFSCPLCEAPINADVRISASLSDVRNRADLTDYTGELQGLLALRITDRFNSASSMDPPVDAATVQDLSFKFAVPCAATSDATGGACDVSTSANALEPGSVNDGDRTIWEVGQVSLYDANGAAFASQGVFVP
jgi:hypothetical protein